MKSSKIILISIAILMLNLLACAQHKDDSEISMEEFIEKYNNRNREMIDCTGSYFIIDGDIRSIDQFVDYDKLPGVKGMYNFILMRRTR